MVLTVCILCVSIVAFEPLVWLLYRKNRRFRRWFDSLPVQK